MTIGENCISVYDNIHPQLPFILYIIEAGTKDNKNTYFNSVNTGNNSLMTL